MGLVWSAHARAGLLVELADRIRLISALGWHLPDGRLVDLGSRSGARTARLGRPMRGSVGVRRLPCRSLIAVVYRDSAPGVGRPVGDR
jgi:hypothetical protein